MPFPYKQLGIVSSTTAQCQPIPCAIEMDAANVLFPSSKYIFKKIFQIENLKVCNNANSPVSRRQKTPFAKAQASNFLCLFNVVAEMSAVVLASFEMFTLNNIFVFQSYNSILNLPSYFNECQSLPKLPFPQLFGNMRTLPNTASPTSVYADQLIECFIL